MTRILIRNPNTGEFLEQAGHWTKNRQAALTFDAHDRAIQIAQDLNLSGVELLFLSEDGNADLHVPLSWGQNSTNGNGSANGGHTSAPAVIDSCSFSQRALKQVQRMSTQLQSLRSAPEVGRLEILRELYLQTHSLGTEADQANSISISRLAAAFKSHINKLMEAPKRLNDTALDTATIAVEVLEEICAADHSQDLGKPPVQILTLDDDLLTRRLIAAALQVRFGKPESVNNAEAAVELATRRAFDVIFLDVRMPGMDGFTACSRIRQTELNGQTPVIFVSAYTDQECREQAAQVGGSGFISKGFHTTEINLMALAVAFRARLKKQAEAKPDLAHAG
jgi:CheY-like chemotaxis protein